MNWKSDRFLSTFGTILGVASILVFLYTCRFYSQHAGIEVLGDPYIFVASLHLIAPVLGATTAAILIARRASGTSWSTQLAVLEIFFAASLLLLAAGYTRSSLVLGPSSHQVVTGLSSKWGHTRSFAASVVVVILQPWCQVLVSALLCAVIVVAFYRRAPVSLPRTLHLVVISLVIAASYGCSRFAYQLVTDVALEHYGTIAAFCWMVGCLIAIPLSIASLTLLVIGRDSPPRWLACVWLTLSAGAIGVAVRAVSGFAELEVFERAVASESVSFRGICAAFEHPRWIFAAVVISVLSLGCMAVLRIREMFRNGAASP